MRSGSLRQALIVEERAEALDSRGQVTETWSKVERIRGRLEPLRGNEVDQAKALYAQATMRVVVRYHPRITTDHRLRMDVGSDRFRTLHIGYVENVEGRNHEMRLLCSEEPA